MADFDRDLRHLLIAAGCFLVRSGACDHEIWFSPITNRTVTVGRGARSRHTANECLLQAGLPKAF